MSNALIIASAVLVVCGFGLMLAAFEVYEIDGDEIVETDWKWFAVGASLLIGGLIGGATLLPGVWA
jgi:hypothetical protein